MCSKKSLGKGQSPCFKTSNLWKGINILLEVVGKALANTYLMLILLGSDFYWAVREGFLSSFVYFFINNLFGVSFMYDVVDM